MNRESSSLSPPTTMSIRRAVIGSQLRGSGSVVEHLLAKEKVAGSIPVSRSRFA
jgi:hypothetical protein